MGQLLATVVVRRARPVVVTLLLLLAAPPSGAQTSGSAPVNWGNDSSTVALWTFNGNANNVSS